MARLAKAPPLCIKHSCSMGLEEMHGDQATQESMEKQGRQREKMVSWKLTEIFYIYAREKC